MNNPILAMLVNHLWQSTLCVAIVAALALLLRRNGARVRYLLWFAASLKFLVPFALLAALGARIPWQPAVVEGSVAAPRVLDVAGQIAAPLAGEIAFPSTARAAPDITYNAEILALIAAVVWASGALFLLGRWLVRWIQIQRALRRSVPLPTVAFPVPVRATEKRFEPGIVGIFRPKLLLPAGIEARLSPEQMQAVLAHEHCHLRWHDNLSASLHMLVETLFWFFPPVWWIGSRLIAERERACDEHVVREGHAPERYAEGILSVCEHYVASRLPCVSGISGADLRKRIENIVSRVVGVAVDTPRKLVLAATTCCVLAAPVAAGVIAGSPLQVLFSLDRDAAALVQYWRLGSANIQHSLAAKPGADFSSWTCPAPDPEVFRQQATLARTVSKMSATDERALLYAVAANSKDNVARLLASGAPRTGDGHLRSDSLMHIAAEFGDVGMLEMLADAGFATDGLSFFGIDRNRTPLMTAISSGRRENARWLVEHGADVNRTNVWQDSALIPAMLGCRDTSLVQMLLDAGAKPNFRALRAADNLGFDLRTDPAMPGPPVQSWRMIAPCGGQCPCFASCARQPQTDYDGDGTPDHRSDFRSLDGKESAVFMRLSSLDPDRWIKAFTIPRSGTYRIGTAKPGRYAAVCASEQLKTCPAGGSVEVVLRHAGVRHSQPGSATTLIYWDVDAGRFVQVSIID